MILFVTGANGFIGSSLCRYFLARGWEVHGLVRPGSDLHGLEGVPVRLQSGDLRDPASFAIPPGTTHVIHAAAIVSDTAGDADCRDNILLLAINLAAKLRAVSLRPRRLLHISTALVLGVNGRDISESRPGESMRSMPYVRYKAESEEFLLRQGREHGLPLVILRPGDVFGPRDRVSCARILRGCERGVPLIVGRGDRRFPFCYIDNLCQAALLALTRPGIEGRAYTVTNGILPTWAEFFSGLQRGLGRRQRLRVPVWGAYALAALLRGVQRLVPRFVPEVNDYRVRRITTETTYDISRTIAELGYRPDDRTERQIAKIVAWYLREKENGRGR
ncbi:MAG: NAD-dependent epimerase/dehydratase family protein [Candidatus Aminicenantes bacterium]|nr:NAD-dependent epimerase/dehydratase family protein [Candidatus Aminicenantes bacterium]